MDLRTVNMEFRYNYYNEINKGNWTKFIALYFTVDIYTMY